MTFRLPATVTALALLLSACGDDAAEELAEGEREAAAEVLDGSISDEMLPLDSVRSQPPSEDEDGGEDGQESDAADEEGEAGTDAE